MTNRHERETLIVFSDADRLEGGDATLYTFSEALKRKALRAGGKVVREHSRKGRVEAWDIAIPANLVRIAFRRANPSPSRVAAGQRLAASRKHDN